jgi:hypothetical protein
MQRRFVNLGRTPLVLPLFVAVFGIPNLYAVSCTTQSEMTNPQRDALSSATRVIGSQLQNGDVSALKANTLPAVAADFNGIAASVGNLKPLLQKANITVNELYILDASTQPPGASRTDFYCGQPVVAMNFTDLPAGTYALAILHATGVPQPQQISLILSKSVQEKWMLAGLFSKPMMSVGHDGLWYWTSARKYAQDNKNWDAWFYYRVATGLLNPLDSLSSSNLEKLQRETEKVKPASLPGSNPMLLAAKGATYSVTALDTTTTFGTLDLDLHYSPDAEQASQLHDPPAARKQVIDIMSALIEQHPELHDAFHGIWVHADQGPVSLFALDLPIDGIGNGSDLNNSSAVH